MPEGRPLTCSGGCSSILYRLLFVLPFVLAFAFILVDAVCLVSSRAGLMWCCRLCALLLWGYSFSDDGMSRRSTLWMDDFDKDPMHAIMLDDYGMSIGPQTGQPGLNHIRCCATLYVDVCASFVPLATVVLPAIQARSTVRPASWCNRAMALRNLPPVDLSRRGMACQSLADHYTQVSHAHTLTLCSRCLPNACSVGSGSAYCASQALQGRGIMFRVLRTASLFLNFG